MSKWIVVQEIGPFLAWVGNADGRLELVATGGIPVTETLEVDDTLRCVRVPNGTPTYYFPAGDRVELHYYCSNDGCQYIAAGYAPLSKTWVHFPVEPPKLVNPSVTTTYLK